MNEMIHPFFDKRIFEESSLTNLLPFEFELTQARTVELVATNTAGAPIVCTGILAGWVEFLALFKPYGSAPASGIG